MKNVRILTAMALVVGLAARSQAAESYDNCTGYVDSLPATITTQGTWCLRQDVTTSMSSGYAIEIQTNNVTLDCNDFKIGGGAAGLSTEAVGIYAVSRKNITIRNCTVRGFKYGVWLTGAETVSTGHVVEDNRLANNTFVGLAVWGSASVARRNLILNTGGGPFQYPAAIATAYGVHLLDNTVAGVTSSGAPSSVVGMVLASPKGIVSGNRISVLEAPSIGSAVGISAGGTMRLLVADNLLIGPGSGSGISCAPGSTSETARVRDNMLNGFTTGVAFCGDAGGNDSVP